MLKNSSHKNFDANCLKLPSNCPASHTTGESRKLRNLDVRRERYQLDENVRSLQTIRPTILTHALFCLLPMVCQLVAFAIVQPKKGEATVIEVLQQKISLRKSLETRKKVFFFCTISL